MSKVIDLTDQQFGYWHVIQREGSDKNGRALWLCRCQCGNEKILSGKILRAGKSKSCGCYKSKVTSELKSLDLTNQRFGKLIAIEKVKGMKKGSSNVWKCVCDCGKEVLVSSSHLNQGRIKSCGCQKSRGESKIFQILTENNINFKQEYIFDDCVFESGYPAKFDFYIDNKYLIEYDGEQHFKHHNSGWSNEDNLRKIQHRDNIKNLYCEKNNIPLIRIPYTLLPTLKLDDLLLETTKNRVI